MLHELDLGLGVDRGFGVGHAGDGGKPARQGRRRAGGDGLVVFASRLAQVNVHVDQARRDDFAAGVDDQVLAVARRVVAGDAAVLDEQIGHAIQLLAGIDDAAPSISIRDIVSDSDEASQTVFVFQSFATRCKTALPSQGRGWVRGLGDTNDSTLP